MVIWIGMLIAPSLENGLQVLVSDFGTIMEIILIGLVMKKELEKKFYFI